MEEVTRVYVGGVVLASEPSRSAVVDLVERASANDCTVCFDPNFRPELWDPDEFESAVGDLLEHVDVAKATVEELGRCGFAGETREALCETVCERGPHTVLVTLGREGAFAYCDERSFWGPAPVERPAFDVEVVDTTGAGDAFVAGTVHGIVAGATLGTTLDTANAMAALSTTVEGAMDDPPSQERVDRFLRNRLSVRVGRDPRSNAISAAVSGRTTVPRSTLRTESRRSTRIESDRGSERYPCTPRRHGDTILAV